MSKVHYRIVQTDDGWVAQIVTNGRLIFSSTSQLYSRKRGAERAVEIAAGSTLVKMGNLAWVGQRNVLYADERTPKP